MTEERLQKVMARAGIASRRASEELIAAGRVKIDYRVATLGDRVDPLLSHVSVDGHRVPLNPDLVYLMIVSGGMLGLSFAVMSVIPLYEMWLKRSS